MTNKLIANKMKFNNYEKILELSEQTKNLFPLKIASNKNRNIKKILLKIKLKTPIRRIKIKSKENKKTDEINQSNFCFENDLENNKNNIGIINYKIVQPKNYFIHSNKLIKNITNLNNSYNDKCKILPNINNSKLRNKSLVQTHEKFDLTLKKVYLGDLSKNIEDNEMFNCDKSNNSKKNLAENKQINKSLEKNKLKKLLLLRNSTDIKLENKYNPNTEKSHRNAKLLKKFYEQKMMKYNKLIKEMEEESQLKKNVMNNYINLMKENFEKNFEV